MSDLATMRDADLRAAVHRRLLRAQHRDPTCLIVDELGLHHGSARVDIVVVNGLIHGFEIKAASDKLIRLPKQITAYSLALDKATLVASEKHISPALGMIPNWWGVVVATGGRRGSVNLKRVRKGTRNPTIEPVAVAQLLWRTEAQGLLAALGMKRGLLHRPRKALYEDLVQAVDLDTLRMLVRHCLKTRPKWRGRSSPSSDDGSFRPSATL